jgi:apolipoprotein N-acyltransferase
VTLPARAALARIAAAAAIGVLLRFVVGLTPVWWLAWLAPTLLLVLALRAPAGEVGWLVTLAVLVGLGAEFPYLRLVMPLPAVLLVIALQALLWRAIVLATRRLVLGYRSGWTVLAYPLLWVGADSLLAALLPDGNWGSLAYSQADRLPLMQVAAVAGVPGVLFVLTLLPSAVALATVFGRSLARPWIAYAGAPLVLAAALGYGEARLAAAPEGTPVAVGLVAVDDAIGPAATPAYVAPIVAAYRTHVASLAAQGAAIVVLPEKIATVRAAEAEGWRRTFASMAADHHVWVEAGIGLVGARGRRNVAWLIAPDGSLRASYDKHFMAPPERREHYLPGADYAVEPVAGATIGLAICKDMHFARLGRELGARAAGAVLVPAWDFAHVDEWLEARTTLVRGIENGYAVLRAGRESLLTVSDPYGRVVAERESAPLPGTELLANVRLGPRIGTLYTLLGDALGWACAAGGLFVWLLARRRPPPPA